MGGAVSTGEDNDELVDNLVGADYIKTPMVEKVFRAVDRASYYLPDQRGNAYKDLAWKHGHFHLSAPCIYSEVMESLQLEPGKSFLNLGSGTGYLNTMVGLILGPYGINHGVEFHADVVEYAQKKLEEFKQVCKSFDDFEFCEPWFVLGNCLQIPSSCRLYDRVYCGASCPPEHENYMKNLLAVGGILVMPLNDQLLQIRRTGETVWESKGVMSVSFATLISPSKEDTNDTVELPEASIPILQSICRDSIRRIIRTNIYKEHPSLNTVRKRPAKKQKARRQRRKRINMVPMSMGMMILGQFNGSDESDDDSIIDHQGQPCHDEEDISDSGSDRGEGQEGSDEDRRPRGRKSLRRRSARQGMEEDIEEDEEEEEGEDEDYESTPRRRVTARQTLHELATRLNEVRTQLSVQRQMDQMSRLQPNEEEENQVTNNEEKDDDEGVEEEDIYAYNDDDEGHGEEESEGKEDEVVQNKSGVQSSLEDLDKEDMELGIFTEMFPPPIPCSSGSPPHKQRYSSSTSVDTSETSGIGSFSEASAIGSLGEDAVLIQAMSSSSSQGSRADGSPLESFMDSITEPTECIDTVPKECIKSYMKEKIDTLPLPEALKAFLMYYRD
ncbi:protein-L-isoaspartate O-methyltransferase domain-containing protein 2-like [Mizuhopecten yessoensis]|uniref:Protein-L-isoaspartate O-methyltransferase domain-containing protein 1 n=1 Tax=Mizuhopecten yessoensis TaxID=6573 RepID=A0A210QAM0_MIZYE|nr:protein-L-isoaspartate O-methyltransferase domain-containing protein 2-like [Mizuhopecten yessoensis]OWF45745.1 Protein-L-isoaspartate O-methyltransferase domain-containing protein 1 [Mizuhopecten yessoensis]